MSCAVQCRTCTYKRDTYTVRSFLVLYMVVDVCLPCDEGPLPATDLRDALLLAANVLLLSVAV